MAKRHKAVAWESIVSMGRALSNVERDLFGDWYRDPWAWPEMRWLASARPDLVALRLNEGWVGRWSNLDVPKENFGTRPAVVLDPIDRLAYQALVDYASVDLIGGLSSSVFGWRLNRTDPKPGNYNNNGVEHAKYRQHIEQFGGHRDMAGLKTDVVSFFSNIDVTSLMDRVSHEVGSSAVCSSLETMLRCWDGGVSRSGIPQRSSASSVLANFYLLPLDDSILRDLPRFKPPTKSSDLFRTWGAMLKVLDGGATSRWMDDVWIFDSDPSRLRQVQVDIEALLRDLGLNVNIAKTDVLEGDSLHAEILQFEHSAVDGALLGEPKDVAPLTDMVQDLISDPEHRSRSSFKFAFKRLRDHHVFDAIDELAAVAERAPHAADAFARLFRDSGAYRDMFSWYSQYWKSNWATTDWAIAQFGTMFPASRTRKKLAERYADYLEHPTGSLALTALAAQRLSAKDPGTYRPVIRSAIKSSSHPLHRRVLVLASLTCGEDRTFLRKSLSEFRENAYLLEMLEERRFKPLPTVSDFSGD